ncbi:MAG: GTP-binding protein [Pseudomonadota bacterium]|nr:GTP-binding protein [Pseudomonadota bacterium]
MSDHSTASAARPIRLTLLTGFLGAGKTTILNRLLAEPGLTDTAVVVNEFGEIGIDQMLVEAETSDGLIELSDGCLCCSVRGELVETLIRLGERGTLARVVVETTGLADPSPILAALMADPDLQRHYVLDGVVCVVDALAGPDNLMSRAEARRQLAVADRIVLTKRDLAEPEALSRLDALIARINASAVRLSSETSEMLAPRILDCGLARADGTLADPRAWLGVVSGHAPSDARDAMAQKPASDEDHESPVRDDHDPHHEHGHHHHGDVRSFSLRHDGPIEEEALASFLELLSAFEGDRLLRMKAVVQTRRQPERPLVLHGVRGFLHPPARLPAWPDGEPDGARLVLIGENLDERRVRDLFAAFTGGLRSDAPDRAAVEDNPLAIPGFRFGG